MSIEKVPVTIITGFLGAGKTTLVRHLMQNPQGRRLAILVNEFGDLGIDGDILKGCEHGTAILLRSLSIGCLRGAFLVQQLTTLKQRRRGIDAHAPESRAAG